VRRWSPSSRGPRRRSPKRRSSRRIGGEPAEVVHLVRRQLVVDDVQAVARTDLDRPAPPELVELGLELPIGGPELDALLRQRLAQARRRPLQRAGVEQLPPGGDDELARERELSRDREEVWSWLTTLTRFFPVMTRGYAGSRNSCVPSMPATAVSSIWITPSILRPVTFRTMPAQTWATTGKSGG
jgi:hypothetical protein